VRKKLNKTPSIDNSHKIVLEKNKFPVIGLVSGVPHEA